MSDRPPRSRFEVTDEQYEWLDSLREEMGLTWRGLALKGEQRLLISERTVQQARAEAESASQETTGEQ